MNDNKVTMNDKILFEQDQEFLTIKIPIDLLVHALETHEDNQGIKVLSVSSFVQEMINRLDGGLYDENDESVLTAVLDECIEDIVDGYDESLDYTEFVNDND